MQSPPSTNLTFRASGMVPTAELEIVSMSSVRKAAAKWLLDGWLPQGSSVVLEGRKTSGKSTLSAAFAAWVTGGPMIPGAKRIQGGVVLWGAGEESIDRETKPKLVAAGARMKKIKTFGGKDGSSVSRLPKFPRDFPWLLEQLKRYKVKLLVLDPVRSFVEQWVNLKDEQHAGMIMEGLNSLADHCGCCCLCLRNMKKGRASDPLDEGIGSVAVGNVSRAILRCIPPEKPGDFRTLRVIATNLGTCRTDHQFKIVGAGKAWRIEWGKAVANSGQDDPLGELDAAQQLEANVVEDLLLRALKDGPRKGEELYKLAERERINRTSVWRMLDKLGCWHKRHGYGPEQWTEWGLPKAKKPAQNAKSKKREKKKREKRESP